MKSKAKGKTSGKKTKTKGKTGSKKGENGADDDSEYNDYDSGAIQLAPAVGNRLIDALDQGQLGRNVIVDLTLIRQMQV